VTVAFVSNLKWHTNASCRGYNQKKIEENITAEIMNVVLDEARDSYDEAIVHEITSNDLGDIAAAEQRMIEWLAAWKVDNTAE
jgi:adenylate kinase